MNKDDDDKMGGSRVYYEVRENKFFILQLLHFCEKESKMDENDKKMLMALFYAVFCDFIPSHNHKFTKKNSLSSSSMHFFLQGFLDRDAWQNINVKMMMMMRRKKKKVKEIIITKLLCINYERIEL